MCGKENDTGEDALAALREVQSVATLDVLKQQYRYAQVGRCVSSVTHDVNNLLGAVLAYAELVQLDAQLGEESRRMLGEIMEAARRCSGLVNNLTSVARKERPDATLVEPATMLSRILDLRRYDLKVARISLVETYEPNLPSLVVDKPKLEQAIIYLITNAMESLEGATERRVGVMLSANDVSVEITVSSSGTPPPEGLWETMFEPFVSSKGQGHMGLGLHLAREIARLHDGDLRYESDRGYVLELPRLNGLTKRIQENG